MARIFFFFTLIYNLDRNRSSDDIVGDLLHAQVVSVPQRLEPQLDRLHGHQSLRVVPDPADIVTRYYLLSTSSLLLSIIRNSWLYLPDVDLCLGFVACSSPQLILSARIFPSIMVASLGIIIYCVNDVISLLFLVLNVLDLLGQLGVPGGGGAIDFAVI